MPVTPALSQRDELQISFVAFRAHSHFCFRRLVRLTILTIDADARRLAASSFPLDLHL